ncbi:MAG: hypothetical protein ABSC02_12705 [Acidobacteriota bacterium]|jgi:hypothetical protein
MNLGQGFSIAQTQDVNQPVDFQQAVALAPTCELSIAAPGPLTWVGYDPGAHHVEVNVSQAIPKMIAAINHGAMETVSPEGAAAVLAEVVVFSKLSFQLLHEAAEVRETVAHPKEVDMITGDTKVKESNPVFAHGLPQAGAIFDSVEPEAQKELAVVTAMRQMVDEPRLDVSIGTCHGEASDKRFGLEAEKGHEIFT